MGTHKNIKIIQFPKQGENLNKRVKVVFNYDKSIVALGVIVRDDIEDPFVTIIRLGDGRYILDTECQYSIGRGEEEF